MTILLLANLAYRDTVHEWINSLVVLLTVNVISYITGVIVLKQPLPEFFLGFLISFVVCLPLGLIRGNYVG